MNEGYIAVLESIASSNPTPGGGTVAALTLAHAHSLAIMVSRLTVNSEKWADGHQIANTIISTSDEQISKALNLASADSLAFDAVMMAYKMPKVDPEARKNAIRQATIDAALAPLDTMNSCLEFLQNLNQLSKGCNSNALTDLASAAELAISAAKIAGFNIKINTNHLSGEDIDSINTQSLFIFDSCTILMEQIISTYEDRLGW